MAHILELSDGTTTIDLLDECGTSPWAHIADGGLHIKPPPKKQTWSGSNIWRQGRTLAKHSYENRDVILEFEIGGSSWDDIFDLRGSINRLLDQAREGQLRGHGTDVYLKYQVDSTTGYVLFDVVDGELVLPKDIMSVEKLGWSKCGGDDVLKDCKLTLNCKPFARGAEVQLVNAGGIYNCDDSRGNNYVSWNGSAVDGDVPGPLRIHHYNDDSGSDDYNKYWWGLRDKGDPSKVVNVLEAEDGTSSGSTSGSNSAYSGSYCEQFSSLAADTTHTLITWDPFYNPSTSPTDFAGRYRVLLVGSGFDNDSLFRITMIWTLTTLREYPWRTGGSSNAPDIIDLGIVEVPPWDLRHDQYSDTFDIRLQGRFAASATFNVDALYFIPADDYKLRMAKWRGYYQGYGGTVGDHGRYDQVYFNPSFPVGILDYWGLPIHAEPGEDARLYFLWYDLSLAYDASYTAEIDVWHTPYYLDVRGAD